MGFINDQIFQHLFLTNDYLTLTIINNFQDIIISGLKKEAAKSSVWIADLQEQNDRLSSQLFMFQMQQNAFLQQQQYKVETNLGTDYSNEVDVKPESN